MTFLHLHVAKPSSLSVMVAQSWENQHEHELQKSMNENGLIIIYAILKYIFTQVANRFLDALLCF